MRKILLSLASIAATGALAFVATSAFFSDTETSTGNVLAAGAIDLLVGNESYITNTDGELVASESTSWSLRDLTIEKFFNFFDLKPGDEGENTVTIQVNDNDAYVCANVQFPENGNLENGLTEPELDESDDDTEGELDQELYFVFWADDGDNVYEDGEEILEEGLASNITLGGGTLAIADSNSSALPGGSTYSLGSYFCYGDITSYGTETQGPTTGPNVRSSGFTCNGEEVGNNSQTDMLIGDISFYAVQSRNNEGFTCDQVDDWPTPVGIQVGANLAAYSAPDCSTVVDPGNSVQNAIDSAAANDVVCLADGVHNSDTYPLELNQDITLAGQNGPLASATLSGGIIVQADGATVTGLILGNSTQGNPDPYSVFLSSGTNDVTISYNIITGPGTGQGILATYNGNNDNVSVLHNEINNWTTGIVTQTSDNMNISYNTIYGTVAGVGNDFTTNTVVSYNVIRDNSEGIGINSNTGAGFTANFNNLYNNTFALASYGDEVVDAENNWWGDITPADEIDINGSGTIDFDPYAMSAFDEN